MSYNNFQFLKFRIERGVLFVTIDHPPINILTLDMAAEFLRLSVEVTADKDIRVVVFDSANPDYFIAHFDVGTLVQFPDSPAAARSVDLHDLNRACEALRRMPKPTIAKVEGRARGGGSELLMALDMRFGAIGRAFIGQPEVPLGIIPGAGGTQRLPRLIGVCRAFEVILGADDLSADLGERYGYFNRALPENELTKFVEALAFRMATFPPAAVSAAKAAILSATELPLIEGIMEESRLFSTILPSAKKRMKKFLESDGQIHSMELDWTNMWDVLAKVE
ncbi:MAG: enoyl-CoA hydratase/isomerase family protein [Deltaproteobacteria bacterium]|nr:enoyl-CoA hydratase/isomerase family protein [Deltaproteobacteria bacterium]